jgi:hypothetical protein
LGASYRGRGTADDDEVVATAGRRGTGRQGQSKEGVVSRARPWPCTWGWSVRERAGVRWSPQGWGSHSFDLAFSQGREHTVPGWVGDLESMGGLVMGAGCGGHHMAKVGRGRRTYHAGPLTPRYNCALSAITVEPFHQGRGDSGSRKEAAGPASKGTFILDMIFFGSVKSFESTLKVLCRAPFVLR